MLRDGDDLLFKAQVEVWTSSLNEHHQNSEINVSHYHIPIIIIMGFCGILMGFNGILLYFTGI